MQSLWTEEFIQLWEEYRATNKYIYQGWIHDQCALGKEGVIPSGGM